MVEFIMNKYLVKVSENLEKKAAGYTGPTAVSSLRRLAQKKKTNPILAKAFDSAHAKAKIYK